MPYIGPVLCTFVRGDPPEPKQRTVLWQVPGIDGYGTQIMGRGDSEFQVVAVCYGTRDVVGTWASALQALQGSIVAITNDWATSYARCLLVRVSPPRYMPAVYQGGARGEIMIHGVVT